MIASTVAPKRPVPLDCCSRFMNFGIRRCTFGKNSASDGAYLLHARPSTDPGAIPQSPDPSDPRSCEAQDFKVCIHICDTRECGVNTPEVWFPPGAAGKVTSKPLMTAAHRVLPF